MRTATVHIPLVQGIYSGAARVYRLDPPLPDPERDRMHHHVAVVLQPGRRGHQLPELLVFAATATGGPVGPSMRKLPGSGTLYFWPDDPEHGWQYALMQLGVTGILEEET